jgi:hypothetical protein
LSAEGWKQQPNQNAKVKSCGWKTKIKMRSKQGVANISYLA